LKEIRKKIRSYTSVSESDLDYLLSFYRKVHIPKGGMLVVPNQHVHFFYFLKKGCICYYMEEDAGIRVMEFFTEGDFFTDLYAYIEEIPSSSYLNATEDTVLYAISKDNALKAYNHSHSLERFGRLSMQEGFVELFRKNKHLKNLSPQERYQRLLQKRPGLSQRVPQYLIASYLGITAVGLSKIRKRLTGN